MSSNNQYMTAEETAKLLRVSPTKIRALCRSGALPGARKIGRAWRVKIEAVEKYFDGES